MIKNSTSSLPLALAAALLIIIPATASVPEGGVRYEDARFKRTGYAYSFERYGWSAAVDGDCVIFGDPWDSSVKTRAGSAYVYRFDPVLEVWTQEAKLRASDRDDEDAFGNAVALSGNVAMIGAPHRHVAGSDTEGKVYVLHYDPATRTWTEVAKLVASDGEDLNRFGYSIALSGDTALIGAYGDSERAYYSGAAYLFRYDSVSGTWLERAKITAHDGKKSDCFGISVAFSGNAMVIGAHGNDDMGSGSGSAYVYRYDPGTGRLIEEANLLASDGKKNDMFGYSVSMSGNFALIGASANLTTDTGAAYVFRYDPGAQSWFEHSKLIASDVTYNDEFGTSVALAEGIALIGAPRVDGLNRYCGAAYVYRYDSATDTWLEKAKLISSKMEKKAEFGTSTALSGGRAAIGAPYETDPSRRKGAGYVYDLFSSTPMRLDIKCNGQDENVVVTSASKVKLDISVAAGNLTGRTSDVWVLLGDGAQGLWSYGPYNGNTTWRKGWGTEYHIGPLNNHSATVLDRTLPIGSYNAFLGVDANANGNFQVCEVICYDVVDFEVVP